MNDDTIRLNYKGYEAVVKWFDEDNVYIGEVTGIRDIVSFHAEEKKDIERRFHMAIDNYLDMKADHRLQKEAEKRMKTYDSSKETSASEVYKEYGIHEKDLESWEDIEIEDGNVSHPYICFTGDTHGDIDIEKLNTEYFPEQEQMTRDDLLIIAGDFGGVWNYLDENGNEEKSDKYLLDMYENRNFTTVFIDGNHDNHEAIAAYPEVEFLGARCHKIRPHVYHVMRGEVLHVGGHRIWCMGGAESHDIEWRTPYESWWPEEIPSEEEWEHAEETLRRERPDIIVTHEAPDSALDPVDVGSPGVTPVSERFDRILDIISDEHIPVKTWYFGHHHQEKEGMYRGVRFLCMYQAIEAIEAI